MPDICLISDGCLSTRVTRLTAIRYLASGIWYLGHDSRPSQIDQAQPYRHQYETEHPEARIRQFNKLLDPNLYLGGCSKVREALHDHHHPEHTQKVFHDSPHVNCKSERIPRPDLSGLRGIFNFWEFIVSAHLLCQKKTRLAKFAFSGDIW